MGGQVLFVFKSLLVI